jgi:hypothetical protein
MVVQNAFFDAFSTSEQKIESMPHLTLPAHQQSMILSFDKSTEISMLHSRRLHAQIGLATSFHMVLER